MGGFLALLKQAVENAPPPKAAPQTALDTYKRPASDGRALSLLARAVAAAPPLPPVELVTVHLVCAATGKGFMQDFRPYGRAGKYGFECQRVPGAGEAGDGEAPPPLIVEAHLISFPKIKCPHCAAKAGPIRCGHCKRPVCFGRTTGESFRCADDCGGMGYLTPGAWSVSAVRHDEPDQQTFTTRDATPAAAPDRLRLSSSTSSKGAPARRG